MPEHELAVLLPHLETVDLELRASLHEPGVPSPWVHFPDSGVLSLLTVLGDGSSVELGHVGNEGVVDIAAFLGAEESESRTVVQVPGRARRIATVRLRERRIELPDLHRLASAYILEFFTMVAQTTACNRRHQLEQRLARWLLMTHDRVVGDAFPITQEFLSEMLGVGRSSVTRTAHALYRRGIIAYRRGTMTVIDRTALEATTCECYALIGNRFERLEGRNAW